MERKKEMFFDGDEINYGNVVRKITEYPNHWEEIIEFIGEIMEDEYEYKFEKKWLEMKFEHDMKELKEKYDLDD